MTAYKCSGCEYTSELKMNVERHINKLNKCSEEKLMINVINGIINCTYCNKEFTTQTILHKHEKNCKDKEKANIIEILKKQSEDLKKQSEDLKELKEEIKNFRNLTIVKQDTIITNTNTFITVQLRPYNDPKLPDDMDDIYEDAWSKKKSIATFIERIHFNPDLPENHNICITNLKSNLVKVFTEQGWVTIDQDNLLNEIMITTSNLMDKWVNAQKNRQEYKDDYFEYFGQVGHRFITGDNKHELVLLFYNGHQSA